MSEPTTLTSLRSVGHPAMRYTLTGEAGTKKWHVYQDARQVTPVALDIVDATILCERLNAEVSDD